MKRHNLLWTVNGEVKCMFITCAVHVVPLCTGYHIRYGLERRETVEVCTATEQNEWTYLLHIIWLQTQWQQITEIQTQIMFKLE